MADEFDSKEFYELCQSYRLERELAAERKARETSLVERTAQLIAHRACCGVEHDPQNGKLHGYCVVCGVPWPCAYAAPQRTAQEQAADTAKPAPDSSPGNHPAPAAALDWRDELINDLKRTKVPALAQPDTPTPRTDELYLNVQQHPYAEVAFEKMHDHALELERENAELRTALEAIPYPQQRFIQRRKP